LRDTFLIIILHIPEARTPLPLPLSCSGFNRKLALGLQPYPFVGYLKRVYLPSNNHSFKFIFNFLVFPIHFNVLVCVRNIF